MDADIQKIIRQLSELDEKNLTGRLGKTVEELGELAREILPYEGQFAMAHRFTTTTRILEEVADLLLCVYSIAYTIGANDEDIHSMLLEKSKKWSYLQQLHRDAKFPVPFEIHITVDINSISDVTKFKQTCRDLEVKPLLLDLQTKNLKDAMTSSAILTDNTGAFKEVCRIVAGLEDAGYVVVRKKVETAPWHPAADWSVHKKHINDRYFESHFNVYIQRDKEIDKLKMICEQVQGLVGKLHLSRNAFKTCDDGTFYQMVTYRAYEISRPDFETNVGYIADLIRNNGLMLEKTIIEYAIFDSKISHDTKWTTNDGDYEEDEK